MTATRRIFLNIVATYGRSLYALVLGLLAAWWALQVLGHVGYGLYGVVDGLTVLIPFLLLHPIIPIPISNAVFACGIGVGVDAGDYVTKYGD